MWKVERNMILLKLIIVKNPLGTEAYFNLGSVSTSWPLSIKKGGVREISIECLPNENLS